MEMTEQRRRQLRVWRLHISDDNAPASSEQAERLLYGEWPAWRIGADGALLRGNLLALWVWGASIEVRGLSDREFVSANVFDVFVRNFDRIPVAENVHFWLAKLRVEREIFGDGPSPFDELRRSSTELKELRNLLEVEPPSSVWRYNLSIGPPAGAYFSDLMDFRTTVRAVVSDGGEPDGFVAQYEPIGNSSSVVADRRRDFDRYPSYVLELGETQPRSDLRMHETDTIATPKGSALSAAAVIAMFVLFTLESTLGSASAAAVSAIVFALVILLALAVRIASISRDRRRARSYERVSSGGPYIFN
jgi:hypothetical protein